MTEAVQHALAASDFEHAAELIEQLGTTRGVHWQIHLALGWFSALPEAVVFARPLLGMYHATVLLLTQQLEASSTRLREVEQRLQAEPSSALARRILGQAAILRGTIALFTGDSPTCIALAHQALDLLPETERIWRQSARVHTIRDYLLSGDVRPTTIGWV